MKKFITTGIFAVALLAAVLPGCKKDSSDPDPVEPEKGIAYESMATPFANPERGFYKTLIRKTGEAGLVQSQLNTYRASNISLVLRFFYLDGFKDKAISAEELALFQADLDKIRIAGLKALLRFGYTDDIAGTDAPLAIVTQHIDQLKPLFEANKDVIAFVQAGFIGAWGEWHSSSNGLSTTANQRAVLEKLLSVLPAELMVQVRTPLYKQAIYGTTNPVNSSLAYTADGRARVGHHNDCFLSGGTDYGTYTNVTAEKKFVSDEAAFVPTGGETCPPTGTYSPNCLEGRNEMKYLKWTYLNLDYYPTTISGWRLNGCFDEFQSNLGYRLAAVEGFFPDEVAAGGTLSFKLSVANKGYAPLYSKKTVAVVLKNTVSGTFYDLPLQADLRTIKPELTSTIEETPSLAGVPAGTYSMYLRISDVAVSLKDRTEYSVRLANKDAWVAEHGGINNLSHQLIIR
ncbi:MAG: DUF4832 domain-containing protein [Chitinophagaceae bacterium]|nr:MAG: DUF4832 domain-containing protein [Chitinophagaceae bacterium]